MYAAQEQISDLTEESVKQMIGKGFLYPVYVTNSFDSPQWRPHHDLSLTTSLSLWCGLHVRTV